MTIAYHEIKSSSLSEVLENGLKCTSRGEKGDDQHIIKTDTLLDKYCPNSLRTAGVSRDNNLYAYTAVNGKIANITDGTRVDIHDFVKNSHQTVLKLTIDPRRCFVSDLDAYDKVVDAMKGHKSAESLKRLANEYWSRLIPLPKYKPSSTRNHDYV
jgi:hypothetical protein